MVRAPAAPRATSLTSTVTSMRNRAAAGKPGRRQAACVTAIVAALGIELAICSTSVWAWDDEGHMMVAAIAWRDLDAAHRARIVQLLKLNPDYAQWTAGVAGSERGEVAFVRAATWPDAIKSDPDYVFDGAKPPAGTSAGQNIGYPDHLQHRYWHYIDVPLSADGTPTVPPVQPNAQTQIELFESSIGSATVPDDVKSYDLVWLEHLVGDVHQPLHATSRFSQQLSDGDRGGNSVALCVRPCRDELHSFWDNVLGTDRNASTAIAAAARIPAPPEDAAAVSDDTIWIQESLQAARDYAYAPPIGPGAGPYALDENYRRAALSQARKRVALAGARLAHLINTNLK
jgi:hypothetical protein